MDVDAFTHGDRPRRARREREQVLRMTIWKRRRAHRLHWLVMFVAIAASVTGRAGAADVGDFISTYCVSCHGPDKQKAERRFDTLRLPADSEDMLLDLQDIVDQLTLGDMPPESSRQPTAEERSAAIQSLTSAITEARRKHGGTGGQSVLRRLNRDEYLNTIRDLFGMNLQMFDPTTKFPRDQTVEQLDTIGDTLVTSGYLLQQYLLAADQIVEKAFAASDRPAEQTWMFKDRFSQQPELDKAHELAFGKRYLCLYECPASERPEGAFGPLHQFKGGVPADGLYEVRVRAAALHRIHPYDPKLLGLDPEEPLRLGIIPGSESLGIMHAPQPFQPLLAEFELSDNEPQWHTAKVWLDAGFSPRFIFPNGLMNIRSTYAPLVRRYPDLLPKKSRAATGIVQNRIAILSHGKLPHVRIHEVVVRGPLAESRPASPQPWQSEPSFTPDRTAEWVKQFADLAYRRPASETELQQVMTFVAERRRAGRSPFDAYKDALKAILCSPAFLYIAPTTAQHSSDLTPHALATRLSYFLWSSMPDEELRRLADSGALAKPDVLRTQTRRLLADVKSDQFVKRFLESWLNLRSLGEMPPDRKRFEVYYLRDLENAMREETFLFTRDLIDRNGSALDFLDCDHSFLNRSLAKLYGVTNAVPADGGHLFRRVEFTDRQRGGLLGHGSVLTVSANGIETSPVIRGVWLLQNLLGTPPAPPPDDVPAIDPDVRGAKSIRDLLAKHRDSATCNECHRKIDPLGFALESFDPIGRWRREYENGERIDTAGELPGGESFRDVAELKQVLMTRSDFFARMLIEKLMAYGCGRRVEASDRPEIDAVADKFREAGYPLRELIEEIVCSEPFRKR